MAQKQSTRISKSRILQISQPTINRDMSYLRQQAKANIKRYIDERLPEEYEKCLVGVKGSMEYITANRRQKREKIQALSLAKECYSMKLDLLTNAPLVHMHVLLEISKKVLIQSQSIGICLASSFNRHIYRRKRSCPRQGIVGKYTTNHAQEMEQ
jgi:hypothetical protein